MGTYKCSDIMLNTHGMWTIKYDKCELNSINKLYIFLHFLVTFGLHIPSGLLDSGDLCSQSTPTLSGLSVQQNT